MRLDKPLPDSVSLLHDDFEWVQPLDYEHVPFHCHRFHALGHLFRDCPLNLNSVNVAPSGQTDQEGFTKIASRKRSHKKPPSGKKPLLDAASIPSTSNSFEVLSDPSADHLLHTPLILRPQPPLGCQFPPGLSQEGKQEIRVKRERYGGG